MEGSRIRSDHEAIALLRERLVARRHVATTAVESERSASKAALKSLLANFPSAYRDVICRLEEIGLLAKTAIGYEASEMRRIDFAWPEKRIGMRITSWPSSCGDSHIPDFVFNDAVLRECGWLILSVDPRSHNFNDQLDRVFSVVKRVGATKGRQWGAAR